MYSASFITLENLAQMKPLYETFERVAQQAYHWPMPAIGFDGLAKILAIGLLDGLLLYDPVTDESAGFMLFHAEPYGALEIKLIYFHPDVPVKSALDTLMNAFLEASRLWPDWQVLSYPVMGPAQLPYMDYLTWYGFQPVGQAVVQFNLQDQLIAEIFEKTSCAALPQGYTIAGWDDAYEDGIIRVLFEAFAQSVDALWDPRFRSLEGMHQVMAFVRQGGYGQFYPQGIRILLDDTHTPVGVCLLNLVGPDEANVPLIGLSKSIRRHKLGHTLLRATIAHCLEQTRTQAWSIKTVSATVATNNLAAIKMYRMTGFQEQHWYPHVYQDRTAVMNPKKWC